jgi:hypothetical protein
VQSFLTLFVLGLGPEPVLTKKIVDLYFLDNNKKLSLSLSEKASTIFCNFSDFKYLQGCYDTWDSDTLLSETWYNRTVY